VTEGDEDPVSGSGALCKMVRDAVVEGLVQMDRDGDFNDDWRRV
jgi:hypothetical protein